MIFLWFQIVGMIFLWFWVRLEKSLMFFFGFEYVFVWGLDMICFMVSYDLFNGFFMVLWFLRQIPTKIVKKS